MDLNMLFENYDLLMDSPNSTAEMCELILQLAVQGKLVEQDPDDEPASELLKRIKAEKEKLIAEGKLKKQKPLPPIDTNDAPYELPNGWVWVRNGTLFSLRKGKKPKNLSEQVIGLPYLNIAALDRDEITKYTDDVKCPQATDEDILVVCDGSRSGLLLNGKNGVVGSTLAVIDSPSIIKSYLKILFAKAYQHLNSTMKGAAIPHLDTKKLLATVTGLPPEAEQKRIVAKVGQLMQLCDQLDACQEKSSQKYTSLNDAVLEELLSSKTIDEFAEHWQFLCKNFDLIYNDPAHVNKLRRAILQFAVQGKLAPQDPNDEPASELLKHIKAEKEKLITEGKIKNQKTLPPITGDEIPYELPQGWEWMRLGEIGLLQRGKSKHRPRNDPKLFKNGKYCFVQTGDVSNAKNHQGLITTHTSKYNEIGLSQSRMWPKGTLCITIAANIAETGFLNFDACFPDSVVGFTSLTGETTSQYTYYFLNVSKAKLEDYAPSTAQKNINLGILDKLVFPLPPLAEQKRIVAKVDQLMHLCNELETRLNQSKKDSETLMQAVLQEAFEIKQA